MRASLLFTRNPKPWIDAAIRAWEGDDTGHTAVAIDGRVIDASLQHGVKAWDRESWLARKVLVQEIPITPYSREDLLNANGWLYTRIGNEYDLIGVLGFPLLRNLDRPNKDWCSELAAEWFSRATRTPLPGRKGRRGVRMLRWMAQGHERAHAIHRGEDLPRIF